MTMYSNLDFSSYESFININIQMSYRLFFISNSWKNTGLLNCNDFHIYLTLFRDTF